MKEMEEREGKGEEVERNEESFETGSTSMSRRDFLKLSGTAFGVAAIPGRLWDFLDTKGREENLSEAASSYIARTPQEATKVSEILLGKGASASNICGPLSVAIMLDWRLKNDSTIETGDKAKLSGIIPADMWLANPAGEYSEPGLFENAFPSTRYETFRINESIGRVDFDNLEGVGKLKPGDFLFLAGGSFTHFITISRQDKEGRIYATSNIHTSKINEFIIDEVMLWDPNTKTGFFREWASGVGAEKARTGTGGFFLYREKEKKDNLAKDSITEEYRNILINKFKEQKKGKWNMHIQELGGKELFEWRDAIEYHPASTIKVPIALTVMKEINDRYRNEIKEKGLDAVLSKAGLDGRSFKQLLSSMLVKSEEAATESCVNFVNQKRPIEESFKEIGLLNTSYLPRRSSQRDLYKSWEELFVGDSLTKESKVFLAQLLGEYTQNDDTLLGTLKRNFSDITIWNKRGAVMSSGLYTVQDTGVVRIGDKFFFVGFAGTSDKYNPATDVELKTFGEEICKIFASYLKDYSAKQIKFSRKERIL